MIGGYLSEYIKQRLVSFMEAFSSCPHTGKYKYINGVTQTGQHGWTSSFQKYGLFFLWFLFCFIVNISIVFQHPQHYITAFLFASCSQSSLQLLVCLNFVHCNPLAELLPRTAQYPVVYVIFFYQYLTTWTHDVFSFTVSAFTYLFAFLL